MHYLIFIPNKMASNRQHLVDAGLGDLLRDGDEMPASADLIGPGPGDLPGQVWTWGAGIPAYLPDRQTWTADSLGRYWFGIQTDSPPTPDDLMRPHPIDGLTQVLSDGQQWVIPNVSNIPMGFGFGDEGQLCKVPLKAFEWYVAECDIALKAVIEAIGGAEFDWKRAFEFVVKSLGINYRVNTLVAVHLGLIEERMLPSLIGKATDPAKVLKAYQEAA